MTTTERSEKIQSQADFTRQELLSIGEAVTVETVTDYVANVDTDGVTLEEILTALRLH